MSENGKQSTLLLDRSDVRVNHDTGLAATIRSSIDKVRSGDLGSLPRQP